MFNQVFCGTIGTVTFETRERLDTVEAKKYAMQQLQGGSYKNCTIGKVYVNGELVLENIKIS